MAILNLRRLGLCWLLSAPPECGSTALKTQFLTAFQHFEYRDGSLGVSRPENQAKRRAEGWGVAKRTISDTARPCGPNVSVDANAAGPKPHLNKRAGMPQLVLSVAARRRCFVYRSAAGRPDREDPAGCGVHHHHGRHQQNTVRSTTRMGDANCLTAASAEPRELTTWTSTLSRRRSDPAPASVGPTAVRAGLAVRP